VPVLAWTVHNHAERQRALRFANQIIFEGFQPYFRTAPAAAIESVTHG